MIIWNKLTSLTRSIYYSSVAQTSPFKSQWVSGDGNQNYLKQGIEINPLLKQHLSPPLSFCCCVWRSCIGDATTLPHFETPFPAFHSLNKIKLSYINILKTYSGFVCFQNYHTYGAGREMSLTIRPPSKFQPTADSDFESIRIDE